MLGVVCQQMLYGVSALWYSSSDVKGLWRHAERLVSQSDCWWAIRSPPSWRHGINNVWQCKFHHTEHSNAHLMACLSLNRAQSAWLPCFTGLPRFLPAVQGGFRYSRTPVDGLYHLQHQSLYYLMVRVWYCGGLFSADTGVQRVSLVAERCCVAPASHVGVYGPGTTLLCHLNVRACCSTPCAARNRHLRLVEALPCSPFWQWAATVCVVSRE